MHILYFHKNTLLGQAVDTQRPVDLTQGPDMPVHQTHSLMYSMMPSTVLVKADEASYFSAPFSKYTMVG